MSRCEIIVGVLCVGDDGADHWPELVGVVVVGDAGRLLVVELLSSFLINS